MNSPKFYQMSLHIHCYMSSAYILYHEIGIIRGKRRYRGKDTMVRAIFVLVRSDYGWRYPPTQDIYDSDVGSVNVQYQMSYFLVILSIDIFDHGGAMNKILPIFYF